MDVDWANLGEGPLSLILDKLVEPIDHVWFGVVYAVEYWGNIVSFDVSYSKNRSNILIPNVVSNNIVVGDRVYSDRVYLVKSLEGDLWLVRRFIDVCDDYIIMHTSRFQVFKLEIDEKSGVLLQMLKLNSLGDNVLFVGNSDSKSLSASYFSNCLQKDSIYYTDNSINDKSIFIFEGPFDSGIYNVKDGNFRKYYAYDPSFKDLPLPVWVEPQFHSR